MHRLLPLVAAVLILGGFTPFSVVRNVCPACPPRPGDEVELVSGARVRCDLVAENADYYIAARHGELRAILKRNVRRITWRGAPKPRPKPAPAAGAAAASTSRAKTAAAKGAGGAEARGGPAATPPVSGPRRALPSGDQIIMVNGVVLLGRISRAEPGRLFQIQAGPHLHTVWRHAIAAVYRAGQRVPLPAAAAPPPPPPARR